jgi:hypothetical protein
MGNSARAANIHGTIAKSQSSCAPPAAADFASSAAAQAFRPDANLACHSRQSASRKRSIRRRGPANGCLSQGWAWESGIVSGSGAPGQPSWTLVHDGSLSTLSQRARCLLPDTMRQANPPPGKNWPLARQINVVGVGLGAGPPGHWSRTLFQDKIFRFVSQRARWLVSPAPRHAYCPRSNRSMLAIHAASAQAGTVIPNSATAAGNKVPFNSSDPLLMHALSHGAIVAR